ncbi:MAG: hypothetical protein CMB55_03940 [Euryarchaeota archaeon]|nr:hypothetical protein [Euryarchaeota archaeon]|tara:strand:+ start:35 stop:562 length:528 start_codon:yes stop_codon:yes gene_type:complete
MKVQRGVLVDNDEWNNIKDVMFLHDSGISPEKISKVKNIDLKRVKEIIANMSEAIQKRSKKNVVQEVGNQNKWKNELPAEEILRQMVESLEAEDRQDGARTIPSRPIDAVDRSDRLGEDTKMNDRIAAQRASSNAPDVLKDVVESATIAQRRREREDWKNVKEDISELLDDDLDL